MWSVFDLVDGYHQMPLKPEHRYITCMSTPIGTMQSTVQVMGLKNGNTQFQRMIEWTVKDLRDYVDPFVDDLAAGTRASSEDELIHKHYEDVRRLLHVLAQARLVCNPHKSRFFMREVEYCGHVLSEGRRRPAPGKLAAVQLWELPRVVTELRGFLGVTNMYSEYIPHFAQVAAPMQELLKLDRHE